MSSDLRLSPQKVLSIRRTTTDVPPSRMWLLADAQQQNLDDTSDNFEPQTSFVEQWHNVVVNVQGKEHETELMTPYTQLQRYCSFNTRVSIVYSVSA